VFSQDYDQRVNVVEVYLDGFNKQFISRDIALLKLSPPLSFKNGRVSPICIPRPHTTFDNGTSNNNNNINGDKYS
jgi:hypothetical protein